MRAATPACKDCGTPVVAGSARCRACYVAARQGQGAPVRPKGTRRICPDCGGPKDKKAGKCRKCNPRSIPLSASSPLRAAAKAAPSRSAIMFHDGRPWTQYPCPRCKAPMLLSGVGPCYECSVGRPRTIACGNVLPLQVAA